LPALALVRAPFRERCVDIIGHIRLIGAAERGSLRFNEGGAQERVLDVNDQHVLKAGVFLHLYNLVESTMTSLLGSLADAAQTDEARYVDLTPEWRTLWRQSAAGLKEGQSVATVLASLERLCDSLLGDDGIRVDVAFAGGNLDSRSINENLTKFGVQLNLSGELETRVLKHVVDELGVLQLIKVRRNGLAHGELSFRECGQPIAVADLRSWAATTILYLRAVIAGAERFVDERGFRRQTV
jgi:MAE_28990/MAE_18760-like HEPN